jgi:hypothetical protein
MSLLSPKFFALPLAAVLIICALPRPQTTSDHAMVAPQKHLSKVISSKMTFGG